jgi:hypothetical protein
MKKQKKLTKREYERACALQVKEYCDRYYPGQFDDCEIEIRGNVAVVKGKPDTPPGRTSRNKT